MDAKVRFFLIRQDVEDVPTRSPALEGGIGEGLREDGVDDVLLQKQLTAPGIVDDVGDGGGGSGAPTGLNAL
jgi:hypothetical protein